MKLHLLSDLHMEFQPFQIPSTEPMSSSWLGIFLCEIAA